MSDKQCVYCGATADLEPISPGTGNLACRVTELCELRREGVDPVGLALRLARGLAKLAWHDVEARNSIRPGSPDWVRLNDTYQPALSGTELARLHLVLGAAADRINVSGQADSATLLAQARKDLGCRICGAIGRCEDCTTSSGGLVARTHGTWGPRWHKGRTL